MILMIFSEYIRHLEGSDCRDVSEARRHEAKATTKGRGQYKETKIAKL